MDVCNLTYPPCPICNYDVCQDFECDKKCGTIICKNCGSGYSVNKQGVIKFGHNTECERN